MAPGGDRTTGLVFISKGYFLKQPAANTARDTTDLFGYFLLFAMFFHTIETYTFFIAFHVTYIVICIRDHTVCHVLPFILFLVTIVRYIFQR